MNEKARAIVLKQSDYREKDALISVITKDYGKISLVCRGVRNITSKNAVSILPCTKSDFIFNYEENKTLFSLKSGNLVKAYKNIHDDLLKISIANVMMEIVDASFPQNSQEEELIARVYDLLDTSLDNLEKDDDAYLVLCLFVAQILDIQGINPIVDECVDCQSTTVNDISVIEGGFVCNNCSKSVPAEHADQEALVRFRLINKAPLTAYEQLKASGPYRLVDASILIKFLEVHSGIKINAQTFLKRL